MPKADTWERYTWPGQGLAIDLADTVVVVRPGQIIDHLTTPEQLGAWLQTEEPWLSAELGGTGAAQIDSTTGSASAQVHDETGDPLARIDDFGTLREAIRASFFAVSRREPPPAPSVQIMNRYSAASPWHRRLEGNLFPRPSPGRVEADLSSPALRVREGGYRVVLERAAGDRADAALAAIADSAIRLLGGPDRERLRVCQAPSCGMFFLAVRPRQIWCREPCGNRARVARHHARQRGRVGS